MAVNVIIPTPLRNATAGQENVTAEGSNITELFANLIAEFPRIGATLYDGEALRRSVNVYVNGEDIRFLENSSTKVKDGDEVSILPAFAGG